MDDIPYIMESRKIHVAVCQNLVPLVNIKIAGKWMFIPLKMVSIGIDPYPCSKPPSRLELGLLRPGWAVPICQFHDWRLGIIGWFDLVMCPHEKLPNGNIEI